MARIPLYEPVVRHAKDVTTEPIRWLWEPYIPRDMLVMLDGDPGIGKSTLIVQIATQLSKDWPFLDQLGKATIHADIDGPQHTVILSAEDSPEHVLVPRLQKAGADIGYIHLFEGMKDAKGRFVPFNLQHLSVLIQTIKEIQPVLVVLDPLVAYLGDIDMHRANFTRPLMSDLAKVANDYHCTIIGIRHPGKQDQGGPLMYRGQGNVDLVGAARSALWVQRHPTHPEQRSLMLHSKTNIAMPGRTVIFTREHGAFDWKGVTRLREEMFIGKGPEPQAFLDAFFWLEETMKPGIPYESSKIDDGAEKEHINPKTLNRAKKALAIRAKKDGSRWLLILPSLSYTHTITCPTSPTTATSPTCPTSPSSPKSTTYDGSEEDDQDTHVTQVDQEGQVGQVRPGHQNGHHPEGQDQPYTCCETVLADNQKRCMRCGNPRQAATT